MISTSYCLACCSSAAANFGPSVSSTEMKFSMLIVSIVWPPMRSASTPVRMPLRAAYTAAAAPAGPPPTMSTSYAYLAFNLAASRVALPVSSFETISSRSIRPWPKCSPFRKIIGTASTWRSATSFWYSPPSITTLWMRGFSTAIRFSACTTSGQLWQVSDM